MSKVRHHSLAAMKPEVVNPKMMRRMVWGERLMAAYMEFKAGFVAPSHHHENEQITYCISGTMRFFFPDEEDIILRGGGSEVAQSLLHSLHNRISLVRATTLAQAGRSTSTMREMRAILEAIERRDPEGTRQACVAHVEAAAAIAMRVLAGAGVGSTAAGNPAQATAAVGTVAR